MSQNRKFQPQVSAGFPQLTTTELCDCLLALGIQVHADDVAKPSAQTTQMIYARLVENMMGAPLELMEQPRLMVMGMMEYKDLYADALQFTMFFQHCRTLASLCGVTNFTMSDLTRPEGQRTRMILSGIMNFAKFREGRTPFHTALQNKVSQQVEKTEKLRAELHRIEASIAEITAKSAADRPKTEAAKARNDELRSELLGLRQSQVNMSHDVEDLKSKRQMVVDQAATKNHEISTLQAQIASTRSRLVQSPERIKRNINEMSHMVQREKATLAGHQHKSRELGKRLDVIGGLEIDLRGLADLAKSIQAQRVLLEEARRNRLDCKRSLEERNIESDSLNARLGQLERQLDNANDKIKRQSDLTQELRDRSNARVKELKEQYVVRAKERGVFQREKDKLLAEQKLLEQEILDFTNQHEAELNDLLQEYWMTRKQAEDYMHTMTVKLGLQLKA